VWTDISGNLWVFGGTGIDANGVRSWLNDLWKYSMRNGIWTWVGGSNVVLARGIYGTKGAPSVENTPGARGGASAWTDASGRFWLFGGFGIDANSSPGGLSELWVYDPGTGAWTWVAGSNDVNINSAGIYGSQGVPSTGNLPGGRAGASLQTDALGNVWLFGAWGKDSVGAEQQLNDLWMRNPRTGAWTWTSGSNVYGSPGSYGIKGVPSASNVPGARSGASMWIDSSGNLWLFGGSGYGTTGALNQYLNDLWKYSP
jgi:N-acetylneuraminic acid mutarotase